VQFGRQVLSRVLIGYVKVPLEAFKKKARSFPNVRGVALAERVSLTLTFGKSLKTRQGQRRPK